MRSGGHLEGDRDVRRIASVVSAITLVFMSVTTVTAQEASPGAGSPTPDESLLAGLGYPEIVITTDGLDFDAPAEIAAGRYRIVVENTSDAQSTDIEFYKVPEDMTFDELVAAFGAADPESESAPDIFFEIDIAGGASAEAGASGDIIVDLSPGEWGLNLFSEGGDDDEV